MSARLHPYTSVYPRDLATFSTVSSRFLKETLRNVRWKCKKRPDQRSVRALSAGHVLSFAYTREYVRILPENGSFQRLSSRFLKETLRNVRRKSQKRPEDVQKRPDLKVRTRFCAILRDFTDIRPEISRFSLISSGFLKETLRNVRTYAQKRPEVNLRPHFCALCPVAHIRPVTYVREIGHIPPEMAWFLHVSSRFLKETVQKRPDVYVFLRKTSGRVSELVFFPTERTIVRFTVSYYCVILSQNPTTILRPSVSVGRKALLSHISFGNAQSGCFHTILQSLKLLQSGFLTEIILNKLQLKKRTLNPSLTFSRDFLQKSFLIRSVTKGL